MKHWQSKLEQYALDLLDGKLREKRRDRILLSLLFLLSRGFRSLTQLRLTLYEQGVLLRRKQFGCTVVSVGNLTVGGTGKTPVVELLARTLRKEGRRVAILSRGYRSQAKPAIVRWWQTLKHGEMDIPPRVVSDGQEIRLNSIEAGDEPYMLATNLPDVPVVVDKDRIKAGRYAISNLGADIMILDDGFQYLRMKPAYNVVLVDATRPFHNHHVLPRGLLREPIKNLKRADLVFLTKSDGSARLRHLKQFIRRHNRKVDIIECRHASKYLCTLSRSEQRPLEWLRGRQLAAISAIAVPEGFESLLRRLGGNLVHTERFIDHHRFSEEELDEFFATARRRGAEVVITTEKDAVRFPKGVKWPMPILYLRVEIEIIAGRDTFEQWISRICFKE